MWIGRILGTALSSKPSCPSRLHLLHNGAPQHRLLHKVSATASDERLTILRAGQLEELGESKRLSTVPRINIVAALCTREETLVITRLHDLATFSLKERV
jgi:hypothetical protein